MTPNKNGLTNYMPINRRFFNHSFWLEDRVYSKAEAWLDLLQSARFEVSQGKALIGTKVITWNRGELVASVRFLAQRWNWGNGKVLRFIELLEAEGMITRRKIFGQSIVIINNYEMYNGGKVISERRTEHGRNTPNAEQERVTEESRNEEWNNVDNTSGTPAERERNETNKENKVKKEEESTADAASASTFSDEDRAGFENFTTWIAKYAPEVSKMDEPFTLEQYTKLKQKYPKSDEIRALLLAMHNWRNLRKKNRSAYYTIMNWKRMEDKR
jgi:hypothetical protein